MGIEVLHQDRHFRLLVLVIICLLVEAIDFVNTGDISAFVDLVILYFTKLVLPTISTPSA